MNRSSHQHLCCVVVYLHKFCCPNTAGGHKLGARTRSSSPPKNPKGQTHAPKNNGNDTSAEFNSRKDRKFLQLRGTSTSPHPFDYTYFDCTRCPRARLFFFSFASRSKERTKVKKRFLLLLFWWICEESASVVPHKKDSLLLQPSSSNYLTMSLNDIVPAGVVTGDDLVKLLTHARENGYAIPAFNCTRWVTNGPALVASVFTTALVFSLQFSNTLASEPLYCTVLLLPTPSWKLLASTAPPS